MDSSEIRKAVFEALKNAHANDEFSPGGNLYNLSAEHIADDLAAFDADLEDVAPYYIQPHVTDWMAQQNWLHRDAVSAV